MSLQWNIAKDFLQFLWAVSRIQFTQQPAEFFPGIAKGMYCVKLFFLLWCSLFNTYNISNVQYIQSIYEYMTLFGQYIWKHVTSASKKYQKHEVLIKKDNIINWWSLPSKKQFWDGKTCSRDYRTMKKRTFSLNYYNKAK